MHSLFLYSDNEWTTCKTREELCSLSWICHSTQWCHSWSVVCSNSWWCPSSGTWCGVWSPAGCDPARTLHLHHQKVQKQSVWSISCFCGFTLAKKQIMWSWCGFQTSSSVNTILIRDNTVIIKSADQVWRHACFLTPNLLMCVIYNHFVSVFYSPVVWFS